jgi:hypothetical protein
MHPLTLRPLAARDRHTASNRPGERHVVRLIAVIAPLLAAAVAACRSSTEPFACEHQPNVNLQGTWHGAAPHATLTVYLGQKQVVEFALCGGTLDGGTYTDSTINAQGDFVPGGVWDYSLQPSGEGGAVLEMDPVNTGQVAVGFIGIVSDTTKNVISGNVIFQNVGQALYDTVAITMVRQ